MGPATIRRFAFVAAILLLASVWSRTSASHRPPERPGRAQLALAPGAGAVPAVLRPATGAWWTVASRPEQGRTLAALGLLVLVAVLRLVPWATLDGITAAPSSLGRRRHVISLRAPPAGHCV